MDIESLTQKDTFVARIWGKLKVLSEKFMAKAVELHMHIKKHVREDPNRIVHSIKVGVTLALVTLIFYISPHYHGGFDVSGIWAILTVFLLFQVPVGATLKKCIIRTLSSLLGCVLGVGAHSTSIARPILLVIFSFLLGTESMLSRFFPKFSATYGDGAVICLVTSSLVAVSNFGIHDIVQLARQKFLSFIISGVICMSISLFVYPIWAGEELHDLVSLHLEKLARYFEGLTRDDPSFCEDYKSVLNSETTEKELAKFARWEPSHGCFKFRHPWKQYLKICALTRECAYQIEALHGHFVSRSQAPLRFRKKIQKSCTKMSLECGKTLRALSLAMKTMTDPSPANSHMDNAKIAIGDLHFALESVSKKNVDLLAILPASTSASILVEIVTSIDKIVEGVHELSRQAHFKTVEPTQ